MKNEGSDPDGIMNALGGPALPTAVAGQWHVFREGECFSRDARLELIRRVGRWRDNEQDR
jgi:hypothetical protein